MNMKKKLTRNRGKMTFFGENKILKGLSACGKARGQEQSPTQ